MMKNNTFKQMLDNIKQSKDEPLHLNSKVLLIDSMNTFLRSFAMINHMNPNGAHIGGLTGFLKSIGFAIRHIKPTRVILVFDGTGSTTNKKNLFPDYKANRKLTRITNWDGFESREDESESITNQMLRLVEYLKCLPVSLMSIDKIEADDVIGTLAKKAEQEGFTVFCMTPDKDFAQLVSENIFIYKPARMGNDVEIMGVKEVLAKWEIDRVDQVIDILGLWGDAVDNIPGIPGIGEKTAKVLIKQYGSMENIIAHSHELKGKMRENVENFAEQGLLSKKLATIILDAPVALDPQSLLIEEPDRSDLEPLFAELEFRTLGRRVFGEEFGVAATSTSAPVHHAAQTDLFGNTVNVKIKKNGAFVPHRRSSRTPRRPYRPGRTRCGTGRT
jgi:DNA polymerase-1